MARKKSAKPVDDELLSLAIEKLESSGLDVHDARALGIDILSAAETQALNPASFEARASLKFNYLGPDGSPLEDWPKGGAFFRLRYLGDKKVHEFGDATGKAPRYVQMPNTMPVAYYPASVDWPTILADTSEPLIITEGELKAAKACKEGFPAIGIGGVWNFRTYPKGVTWIESLDFPNWVRRRVFIVFDSDYRTNAQVLQALREFAFQLERRGAFCHIVALPQEDDLKVGLDDFLIAPTGGPDRFVELLQAAEPLGLSKPLWAMNTKFVYVANPGLIVREDNNDKVSPGAFKEHVAAAEDYVERKLNDMGEVIFERTSAAAAWLRWPLRRQVQRLTYTPGKPKFYDHVYNCWPGWGVEPEPGDVTPFLQFVDHIFLGAEPEAKTWFMKWLAFPLQYPGTKMYSSAFFHGRRHGTGKSLIGYTMQRIYGSNFTALKQRDLHATHNEWAENKQFVLADDVTGSTKREDADLIKAMITQLSVRLNPKYIPSYEIPDCLNYYWTSNQPDAVFLEDDDRRFFIHEVLSDPLPEEFFVEFILWLDSGGSSALFDYLLKLELDGFNPAAPAMRTAARDRMINDVRSDLGAWTRRLLSDPENMLKLGEVRLDRDVYTNRDLLLMYDPGGRTGTTANGLGRELRRAGVAFACGGLPVKTRDGSDRYYIIRHAEKWLTATPDEIRKHVDGEVKPGRKGKKF